MIQKCWKLDVKYDCTKKWQKDARTWIHDFICRAMFKNTYSEFGAASRLDFDPNIFVGSQERTPR